MQYALKLILNSVVARYRKLIKELLRSHASENKFSSVCNMYVAFMTRKSEVNVNKTWRISEKENL